MRAMTITKERGYFMSKEEIVLELVKLVYEKSLRIEGFNGNPDYGKVISDLYNQIYENIKTEQSE